MRRRHRRCCSSCGPTKRRCSSSAEGIRTWKMARLAREVRDRPLVRLAVQSGEMSVRQAEAILPLGRGDAGASWVARGRMDTVRGLKVAVKDPDAPEPEEDEEWGRLSIPLSEEHRPVAGEGVAIA